MPCVAVDWDTPRPVIQKNGGVDENRADVRRERLKEEAPRSSQFMDSSSQFPPDFLCTSDGAEQVMLDSVVFLQEAKKQGAFEAKSAA